MLQDLVAKFIDRDVMPLEKAVLAREMSGQKSALTADEEAPLLAKCRELGLWGLDVPEEFGGANLPTVALIGVYEEQGCTCVPFTLPARQPKPAYADGRSRTRSSAVDTWNHTHEETPTPPTQSPSLAPAATPPA